MHVIAITDQDGSVVEDRDGSTEIQFVQADGDSSPGEVVAISSGELDPNTGVYYTTEGRKIESDSSKPQDFLSNALSQAQIDLDPYQFMEQEEMPKETPMVSLLNNQKEEPQETTIIISSSPPNGESSQPRQQPPVTQQFIFHEAKPIPIKSNKV
jgi:hypothetical protein